MASQNPSDTQGSLANRAVKEVYPVSRIVREARALLEGSFPLVWVEGEISNLAMPGSGHIYFTLKDEVAQVRCAMFRNRNRQLRFTPENGMQVLLRVRVTLYERRGEFQLVAEHMEEAGSGALQRAYEALKQRLGQEGLFDDAHKKALPVMPSTIGVISSPDGAAVHDILSVLKRRFPAVNVILYPVAVQGETSARQLVDAVKLADARKDCDVLIIGRGGGSLEDLWSFNDEQLARALFNCELPIISAVGHEIDFTIADFVADVRAPTPSAAAEMAVPDAVTIHSTISNLTQRFTNRMRDFLHNEKRHVAYLQQRLPRPERQIRQHLHSLEQRQRLLNTVWQRALQNRSQRVDYLAARLTHPKAQIDGQRMRLTALQHRLCSASNQQQQKNSQLLNQLGARLQRQLPAKQLKAQQNKINTLQRQLHSEIRSQLDAAQRSLSQQIRTLSAVSPLNTLERGYSITSRDQTGEVVTRADSVSEGERITVRLHQGALECEVKGVKDS